MKLTWGKQSSSGLWILEISLTEVPPGPLDSGKGNPSSSKSLLPTVGRVGLVLGPCLGILQRSGGLSPCSLPSPASACWLTPRCSLGASPLGSQAQLEIPYLHVRSSGSGWFSVCGPALGTGYLTGEAVEAPPPPAPRAPTCKVRARLRPRPPPGL